MKTALGFCTYTQKRYRTKMLLREVQCKQILCALRRIDIDYKIVTFGHNLRQCIIIQRKGILRSKSFIRLIEING